MLDGMIPKNWMHLYVCLVVWLWNCYLWNISLNTSPVFINDPVRVQEEEDTAVAPKTAETGQFQFAAAANVPQGGFSFQ